MALRGILFIHLSFLFSSLVLGDIDFSFEEDIFAHVIKSTSKPLSALFHINAPHCKYGRLEYQILEKDHPFKISPKNGTIYLKHALDVNSPTRFTFTVQVQDANELCFARTEVQVFVIHVNEHKPIMSAAKYYCFVNENERTVEVRPKIQATDQDEGEAGRIQAIRIREQGVPFKIVIDGEGNAKMVATEDLDAESMTEYRFSIYAVDNGTRARKSERSKVYCNVIDVNEYGPIFKHPSYELEVFRGETYKKIIQVEAVDRDISNKNGKVCNYAIIENGIPFSINSIGVISLQEELPQNYPDFVEFHLRATDCASKASDDDAVVKVKIKSHSAPTTPPIANQNSRCVPGVTLKGSSNLQYLSCGTNLQLLPNFDINDCRDTEDHRITVSAVLDSSLVRKGCERSHGTTANVYSKCGVKDFADLLSNPSSSWVEDLVTEETVQGETNYIFDGNFAARLPMNLLENNWQESFTIAGWIMPKKSNHRQFILSLSDGKKFGHNYVGLYIINKQYDKHARIGFIMNKNNGRCKFHEEWEVSLGDMKWRHIAVVVEQCNLQLRVHGVPVEPISIGGMVLPDQSHIQPKYVIGGRWLGTNEKYTEYFKGKLSQMVFIKSLVKNFNCILKCEESLELLTPLPSGFQMEKTANQENIYITGRGTISSLNSILNGLVYYNKEPYPTPVNRKVHFEAWVDEKRLSATDLNIETLKNERPKIKLAGSCDNKVKTRGSVDAGIRICPDISIKVDGCLRMLDEATVTINSDVADTCKLSVPNAILERFDLTASYSDNVLRIKGLARSKHYVTALSNVIFTPSKYSMKKSVELKMEVSAENDRFSSNDLVVEVEVDSHRAKQDDSSFFFLHSKSDVSSPGSLIIDKNSKSNHNNGAMIIGVVLSLTIVVGALGFVVFRFTRKPSEDDSPETNRRTPDLLWDDEGLTTAMNITMNPLLRFRPESSSSDENLSDEQTRHLYEECSEASLYWSESEDDNEVEAKNALEWDSSYHEGFGEEFGEVFDEKQSSRKDGEETDEGATKYGNDDMHIVYSDGKNSELIESRL